MDQIKLHSAIAALAKFPGTKEEKPKYLEMLQEGIDFTVQKLSPCHELEAKLKDTEKITMRFIHASLYVLRKLSEAAKDDSCQNLISIQQQQKIKVLLQMIFSIGILPSLVRGVDIALANKTVQLNLFDLEDWTLVESYNMMREVVRSLLKILKSPNLRSLVLIHLGDLMAALLQLIHIGDIKKPVKSTNIQKSIECVNQKGGQFVMTEEWHEKLVQDRVEFKAAYNELVEDIYKPLVIRELLILLAPVRYAEGGKDLAPPMWLRRAVSQQLSGYLTRPGGVSLIMRAMCDSTGDNVDWKKVDAIAKLISTVHGNLTQDEFYSLISRQIIALLNTTGAYCLPVAKKCIRNIYQENAEICNKYIFDKLFEPFIICSKPLTENFNGTLISEDSLSRCIDHINKCFTPGSKESTLPFKALIKIIKIKFKLYTKVAGSPYQYHLAIQDLLIRFLYSENDPEKLTFIYNALIFNEPHKDMLEMNEDLEFEFGPAGGVQVVKRSTEEIQSASMSNSQIELSSEVAGDFILDLLSANEQYSKILLYSLFVVLLSSMMTICYNNDFSLPGSNNDLLDADELIVYIVGKSQKKMITIKLLAVLAENVQVIECIQENPEVVLKFLEQLLKRAETILNEKNDNESTSEENDDEEEGTLEDLMVIMGILDAMTTNIKIGSEKWNDFKPLLKSMAVIKDQCSDTFVKFLASLLYERIMTHGAVSGSKKSNYKSLKNEKRKVSHSKPKTEEKSKTKQSDDSNMKNKRLIIELTREGKEKSEFDVVMETVADVDIPTRGHGLIELAKLIKKMDSQTISSKDLVLSALKRNLKHEDSYIYLAAINGLEAMAGLNAEAIIELLSEEYIDNKKDDPELQMKIGEVLVRVTRSLGDVIPKYKAILVNTFLNGAKSKDDFVRASSLSNLGEVLKILGFGIGPILQEVYACVQCIATTDKSDMARRAAVLVAQLLLQGVSEATFMVLESVIRDLYRALLHIYKTDKDDVTRLHADLALAEVDRIVMSSFYKEQKLEKHIRVLDFPR